MRQLSVSLLAVLSVAACANNSLLPETDRIEAQQELQAHARYLKVAMRVAPFFQDDSKWLLTDRALDEIDLIDGADGKPVQPGNPIGILPPGTRLRIERVEFPTALVTAERVIYSPRYNPWVYLVPTEGSGPEAALAHGKPFILVLPPQLATKAEVFAEVDRYLAREDLRPQLSQLTPQFVDAIGQKTVLQGMSPDQVQMAWGYPEHIHIDEAQKLQVWTWPYEKQQATFKGGLLVKWTNHGTPGGSAE